VTAPLVLTKMRHVKDQTVISDSYTTKDLKDVNLNITNSKLDEISHTYKETIIFKKNNQSNNTNLLACKDPDIESGKFH